MKETLKKFKWILSQGKSYIIPIIIITLIESLGSLISVYSTLVAKRLVDSATSGAVNLITRFLMIMIMIFIVRNILNIALSFLSTHWSTQMNNKLQFRLYENLTHSKWTEYSKYHSMNLLTRLNNDVSVITGVLFDTIPSTISTLVLLTTSLITLIKLNATAIFPAMFIFPIGIVIAKIFGQKMKKLNKEVYNLQVKFKTFMQESIQNIIIVKSFSKEHKNFKTLKKLQKKNLNLSIKSKVIGTFSSMSLKISAYIGYFIVFTWGIFNLARGTSTYGTFTALLQLFNNVQGPFSSLASLFPQMISLLVSTERLMEIDSIPKENMKDPNITNPPQNVSISFNNVNFSYNQKANILNNISFNINPGEIVALIGPSGEGKTTIIRLLLSLIKPNSGNICVLSDNNAFTDVNLREFISYVPQGNTLFTGTIKDNVNYGDEDATLENLEYSLELACASDFVDQLPNGISTEINEKGGGISEGQAQRLAIARAFLREKPILILDEATSSLDPKTEIAVLNSVKNLKHKPICLIITHRPSALNICDR
ncbi:MAG: ABC transporter ATP-binding protein, partial [Clostridium perfringens]|nr:ABC transporter ATP-binding protein [Clostridium perfringens]